MLPIVGGRSSMYPVKKPHAPSPHVFDALYMCSGHKLNFSGSRVCFVRKKRILLLKGIPPDFEQKMHQK
jgi:hypothetical protein